MRIRSSMMKRYGMAKKLSLLIVASVMIFSLVETFGRLLYSSDNCTTRVSFDNEPLQQIASRHSEQKSPKEYASLQGITLLRGDSNFADIDTTGCPNTCMKCLEHDLQDDGKRRAQAGMYSFEGGTYCSGYCNARNLRCQKAILSNKNLVDCRNCSLEVQTVYFDQIGPVIGTHTGDQYGGGDKQRANTDVCAGITQWGEGDDTKFLCTKLVSEWPDSCIIISLGGNGQWDFERDAHAHSPCEIHTFDCTGSWAVPFEIGSRVTFHQKCVGLKEAPKANSSEPGFENIQANRMITISHVYDIVGGQPDYLKMDIEGFEWKILPSIMASDPENLPVQIQVEIHQQDPSSLTQMIQNLKEHYSIVKRHDNPFCRHCSEILLVLTDKL